MFCAIQEVKLKKENLYGEYKELEVNYTSWVRGNGVEDGKYGYRYAGERFERPIKKAYKVSIHKSYREDGKVKKKQWVIGTMEYYDIATNSYWIGDYLSKGTLEEKLAEMEIREDELWDLVDKKLDPLIEKIQAEYRETEEYLIHKKHKEILSKYNKDKVEFEKIYGENSYDKCYDIFGKLRNKEMLDAIKRQYKTSKEKERRYYKEYESNYNDYSSSYQSNKRSNHSGEDKEKYKKLYKTLAKAYHPDIIKDDGEMMKIVNKLKTDWGI